MKSKRTKPMAGKGTKSWRNEQGQGLVEYALILVLVAIVVIAILLLMGPQIANEVISKL